MTYSSSTPWYPTSVPLRALFVLPDGRQQTVGAGGPHADGDGVTGPGTMLSHAAFRATFLAIPPGTYVTVVVVACYLGLSVSVVERTLAASFGRGRVWRTVLARAVEGAVGHERMRGNRFRWSFVTGELESMLAMEMRHARARCQPAMAGNAASHRAVAHHRMVLTGQAIPGLTYLVDARGRVMGALGQGGLAAEELIDALGNGGWLAKLPPVEALSLPWTSLAMRAPWDEAVCDLVRRFVARTEEMITGGRLATRNAGAGPHSGLPGVAN